MSSLLEACKKAYRKHVLDDDSIGWDELSDALYNALCNEMGSSGYILWMNKVKKEIKNEYSSSNFD